MDGKPFLGRLKAWAFRHRPALEDPVKLESKVVMKVACCVFLDYIEIASRGRFNLPLRLRGALEAAFFKYS